MRTAVYVRVSTQRQSQAQTIDQQLARLRAHLAAQGEELHSAQIFHIPPDFVVAGLYPSRSPCNGAGVPPCWVISGTDHLT
jgi:hypothetical protein